MEARSIVLRCLSPLVMGAALSMPILGTSCRPTPEANAAQPGVPVQLERLDTDEVRDSTEFVGNLEATQIAEVRPEIQGRIEQILVAPGQEVGAGQSIMVLSPDQTLPQFQGAVAGVDVAIGQRDNALKALDVARAQRETAEATLSLDNVNVARARTLVIEGGLSQLQLDEALVKQEASKNQLLAANEQIAAAETTVRQAEAQIRQAQSQAAATQVSVGFKDVVAPIGGVMDDILVKVGDYVSMGQSVTKVAQTETVILNIQVPPERAGVLRTGLAVELLDPTSKQLLATGSLNFVAPTVNSDAQAIQTKAQFRNVDGLLRDGQFVSARIIWDTQPGVLIPTTAVTRVGGKDFVFRVADEPNESGQQIVNLHPVELGAIQGDRYQVLSGLTAGDEIAVSNILKLRDSAPIESESGS